MNLQKMPNFRPRLTKNPGGTKLIFDKIRKKNVVATPEEWVRQAFIHYLIEYKHFPPALIAIEYSIDINGNNARCDIVIFTRAGKAAMIVECKANHININQTIFDQIANYNTTLKAPFLIVTNGVKHYSCKYDNNTYQFIPSVPDYETISKIT